MNSNTRLIICIDYGCTSTGVAYVPSDGSPEAIREILQWPGKTARKVPSLLWISEAESPHRTLWGFEAHDEMVTYAWTKLLLDQNFNPNEFTDVVLDALTRSQIMKLPYGTQAKTMVATYLEKLNQHIWGLLKGRNIDADSTPIEYWLAAPAHWREETKLLLMQAAEEAGFKAKPADRIHMVSEAEAAALSVLHTFASRLEVNDGLLVCDCGGGTVDIGTFYISDVEPRLFFEELTAVQGGKCGGAAVDSRFYQLLRSQLGDALQSVPSAQLGPHGKLMTNFQSNIKSGFTGRAEESFHIPLELHGVAKMDSSIYDGRRKHVILTSEHLRQIFDPVLDRILELIIKQKAAADRKFGREVIHKIILTGGFSNSPYLRSRLEGALRPIMEVEFLPGNNSNERIFLGEAAVSYGACLRGLMGNFPPTFKACRHYGIASARPFSLNHRNGSHILPEDWPKGTLVPQWVLRKGVRYPRNFQASVTVKIYHRENELRVKMIGVYESDDPEPPAVVNHSPAIRLIENITSRFTEQDLEVFPSQVFPSQVRLQMLEAEVCVQFEASDRSVECVAFSSGTEVGRCKFALAYE